MPTGGAELTKDIEKDGAMTTVKWPFHPAMWEIKEIVDARAGADYVKKKRGSGGGGRPRTGGARGRVLTDREEEMKQLAKEIAGLTAALAAMPAGADGRAKKEEELADMQARLLDLHGVKKEAVCDGAAAGTIGADDAGKRISSGPAGLLKLLDPITASVAAMTQNMHQKESAEEAQLRRDHELRLKQMDVEAQVRIATAQAQANAAAFGDMLRTFVEQISGKCIHK